MVFHGFFIDNEMSRFGRKRSMDSVENQPPVSVVNADVTTGKAPLVVALDSSGSTVHDGTLID